MLLSHLKQIFDLETTEGCEIKKDDTIEIPTITVKLPSPLFPPIKIKLAKATNKVLVTSTVDGLSKKFSYDLHQEGQEMLVNPIGSNE